MNCSNNFIVICFQLQEVSVSVAVRVSVSKIYVPNFVLDIRIDMGQFILEVFVLRVLVRKKSCHHMVACFFFVRYQQKNYAFWALLH